MSDDLKQKLATGFWIALFGLFTTGGVKLSENHSDNHFNGSGALALDLSNHTARIDFLEKRQDFLQSEIDSMKKQP